MYVRVVRFTGVTPERMEEVRARVQESGGTPPGALSATGLRVLLDESQGTAVVLQEFASAEDMQEGERSSPQWTPGRETPGTRASVDMCEVAFEERM